MTGLKRGDHLCHFYETDEEHRAVLTPFLRRGLQSNEKVVYVVAARRGESILGYLRDDGVDVASCLASGQLLILSSQDVYLRGGCFDPDRMIDLLRTETARAVAAGYSALRVTGEMSWALRGLPGSGRLVEYESKLNAFFPGTRCLAVCQYDRRLFDPGLLLDVLATHPLAVIRTDVCKNADYIPPSVFTDRNRPGVELGHRFEALLRSKRAEEVLRREQACSRAILSSMADALFVISGEGAIRVCSQRALEMLGYERDQIVGRSLGKIFMPSPGMSEADLVRLRDDLRCGEIRDMDIRLRRRDGSPVPVSLSCVPLIASEGGSSEIVLVARDITDRKRLQGEQRKYADRLEREVTKRTAEIRRSEGRYRALFQNVAHAVITTDPEGDIRACNSAAEHLFDCTEAEIVGRRGCPGVCGKPNCPEYPKFLAAVLKMGSWTHECSARSASGREIPVNISVSTLQTPEGATDGMIWIITDLSERERLEEEARRAHDYTESILRRSTPYGELVGQGASHRRMVQFVRDAAGVSSPVLLLGESGTGKEVVARAIHRSSPREREPFVVVDCAALGGSLLESEIFGHEKGAFTGAHEAKAGLVEVSAGGTLFVDEIGEMPLELQSKLLRVLERGEFRRVGSTEQRKVDIRVIAATNRDLAEERRKGRFRGDLYFRLNVLSFSMPPLRERREDVPLLAQHFLEHTRVTLPRRKRFRKDTISCLQAYEWPGNIRELANLVERAIILSGKDTILQPRHFPPEVRQVARHLTPEPRARSLGEAEKEAIEAALTVARGNKTKAAKLLGIARVTLREKMRKYGIPAGRKGKGNSRFR